MKIGIRVLVAVLLVNLTSSGWSASGAYRLVVSEESTTASDEVVRQLVRNWINCYECTNGELRKVVNAGTAAIPFLNQVLAGNPDYFPNRDTEFEDRWEELRYYADSVGGEVNINKPNYVTFQNGSLRLTYRARAEKAKELIAAVP